MKKHQKRKRVAKNSFLLMILVMLKQMKVKQSKEVRLRTDLYLIPLLKER